MQDDHPEYIIDERMNEFSYFRRAKEGENTYYVKWLGCDITDNTWETETNLKLNWPSALAEYKRERNSGRLYKPRKKVDTRKVFKYTASVEDWETAVDEIVYIEKSKYGYIVFVNWKNGYKSIHHSSEVYAKCPQKMIEFFEKFAEFNEIFDE